MDRRSFIGAGFYAALLGEAGHEAGNIDQGDNRDIENIAGADKARALVGGVDVEAAAFEVGLIGDDTYDDAFDPRKADDDILGPVGLNLKKISRVDHLANHIDHIERFFGISGQHIVHALVGVDGELGAQAMGRIGEVIRR